MNNNVDKTKEAFKLHTGALYRDITEIEYTPEEEVKVVLKRKAGDKRRWKFLGLIPLWKYTVEKNVYVLAASRNSGFNFSGLNEIANFYGNGIYHVKDSKLYHKARVYVRCVNNSNNTYRYFTSNAEALNYVEELKDKCKEYGNLLS